MRFDFIFPYVFSQFGQFKRRLCGIYYVNALDVLNGWFSPFHGA